MHCNKQKLASFTPFIKNFERGQEANTEQEKHFEGCVVLCLGDIDLGLKSFRITPPLSPCLEAPKVEWSIMVQIDKVLWLMAPVLGHLQRPETRDRQTDRHTVTESSFSVQLVHCL